MSLRGYGPNRGQVRRYLDALQRLHRREADQLAVLDQQFMDEERRRGAGRGASLTPHDAWLSLVSDVHSSLGPRAPALLRCANRASRQARMILQDRRGSWIASLGASSLVLRPFTSKRRFSELYGVLDQVVPQAQLGPVASSLRPASAQRYAHGGRAVSVVIRSSSGFRREPNSSV